jgi:hypothetical protein
MVLKPIRFISEIVEVLFNKPPVIEKKPECPEGFVWDGESYQIVENMREWKDFSRRGRMAHSMRPANLRKAARRGSIGVGRFHFWVKVAGGRIFDIYYDRAVKSADERKGVWILHQELMEE